jgi:hypothetical protein
VYYLPSNLWLSAICACSITDPADPEGKAGPGVIMTVTMPSIEVGTVRSGC